jgi:hypothetical protein
VHAQQSRGPLAALRCALCSCASPVTLTRLDEVVVFYRDGVGLPEIGGFRDHHGYDGVFLGVPGSGGHLEFTSGGARDAPQPHPESLYLGDRAAVDAVAARSAPSRSPRPTRTGPSTP